MELIWNKVTPLQPPCGESVVLWLGMTDPDGGFPSFGKRAMDGDLLIETMYGFKILPTEQYRTTRWASVTRPERTKRRTP